MRAVSVFLLMVLRIHAVLYGRDHLAPKHLVVSFYDGPNNLTTPKLLDALRTHAVRATFFVVGVNVDNPRGNLPHVGTVPSVCW